MIFFKKKGLKVTELTYSIGKTIQIKQFEPISIHASIKAEVGEGENVSKAYLYLKILVKNQIKADIQELQDKKTEAENKVKFPFGQCSTCGEPLARSKKGDLYCPNSFKNYEGNPHHKKDEPTEAEKKFSDNLK